MTAAIIAWVLANPTILAIAGAFVAALGWGWKQRRAGAASERAKQAMAERRAETIADQVDNDVGATPPDIRRKELGKWAK